MSRKIVFINQATGYLTVDIINEFAKEFDEVGLITGSIRIQNAQLNQKVKISSITEYNRGNKFRKTISWLIGTLQIFFLLKFRYKDFEKFFFTIPPTAYLLALYFKSFYAIAIYDLYPETLKTSGFKEEGIIIRWWSARNREIFGKAQKIFTLSEYMKSQVLDYCSDKDVRVIANWSAFSGFKPIRKDHNSIIKREGLINKFIIQYSGNIGVTHNVETLIEVANMLKLHQDLEFQIIGRGEKTNEIRDLIKSKGLAHCKLLPFRKDEELYESLCAADLAVITLDSKASDFSVPSKVYNIMAAGLPVMAITSLTSAISEVILQCQIGRSFEKDNIIGMCEFVLELRNNSALRNRLSANALEASQNFTNENAAKYLEFYNE